MTLVRQPPGADRRVTPLKGDDDVDYPRTEVAFMILLARHRIGRRVRMIDSEDLDAVAPHGAVGGEHAFGLRQVLRRAGEGVDERVAMRHAADALCSIRDDFAGEEAAAFVR